MDQLGIEPKASSVQEMYSTIELQAHCASTTNLTWVHRFQIGDFYIKLCQHDHPQGFAP